MKRRQLLAAAAVGGAGVALGGSGMLSQDRGGAHSEYYLNLSAALDRAGLARPTLIVDKARLEANVDTLVSHLQGKYDYRVVAKSLPSLNLLRTVMNRAKTRRLMVFHQPFLNLIAAALPNTDVLLGKPMPVVAAASFYKQHKSGQFSPGRQLQWLIDSPQRLQQYLQLARAINQPMQVNFELDVGLHRGGFKTAEELVSALRMMDGQALLNFSGFMGYEPHVAKMPALLGGPDKAFAAAQQRYNKFIEVAQAELGGPLAELTLNAGGSPTYQRYNGQQVANELSVGSALVKPADFDLDSLADHVPASFIATPVLKALPVAEVPGIERVARLQSWFNPNCQKAFFLYGGYWKAQPESPPGLAVNGLFGRSTNQEMLNGSRSVKLEQDDWVFLRPTQSEHVFLQFGDIAVYEGGEITGQWPVFTQGA